MKVSYKWLQQYFDGKLPAVAEAVNVLTMNSSEVDGVEKVKEDYVLDVKILPNMAHSCLCHRGIAREFSALLNLPMKKYSREFVLPEYRELGHIKELGISKLNLQIKIQNSGACRRYIGRVVENIKIAPSPDWLRNRLEVLGQRSINNLVDATNFVMLELGQPMHVFDADKIMGNTIEIKMAGAGDEIKTLDGKHVVLDDGVLTISNNNKALAIAGIKGGTLAEIDGKTKNIILESANFDPVLIRKTAQRIKIQTDASKRYENELTPELCAEAMELLTKLILEIASTENTKLGKMVDIYPNPVGQNILTLSVKEVEKLLGLKIKAGEIAEIFKRFDFIFDRTGDDFSVTVPVERLDLRIKEDLIEEIGRVYGYEKLVDNKVESGKEKGKINKTFYYANKVREILVNQGFSEIYGYAFAEKGDIELANSVAPEKKWLRNNLSSGIMDYLEFNARYSELINMPQIKIFEIGKVFKIDDEHNNLVLGVKTPSGNKGLPKDEEVINKMIEILEKELDAKLVRINKEKEIAEFNFDELTAKLPEAKAYDTDLPLADKDMRLKKISVYPFSVRDVAVFVPEGVDQKTVQDIIEKEAGNLLVRIRLFDVFTKKFGTGGAKTSYAFRLVLQSYEHTLSEEEINTAMAKITSKLNAQTDWQVR